MGARLKKEYLSMFDDAGNEILTLTFCKTPDPGRAACFVTATESQRVRHLTVSSTLAQMQNLPTPQWHTRDASYPVLPPELVDLVVDFLSDDWRVLVKCALVHPEWAPRACMHLAARRDVALLVDKSPPTNHTVTYMSVQYFEDVFLPETPLTNALRHLGIHGSAPASLSSKSDQASTLPSRLSLSHLTQLRSLTLKNVLINDIPQAMFMIWSCLSLEELCIESIGVRRSLDVSQTKSASVAATTGIPSLPRLKEIRVLAGGEAAVAFFNALEACVCDTTPPTPVRSLTLRLYSRLPCKDSLTLPLCAWTDAILNICHTLEDLDISTPMPLHYFPEPFPKPPNEIRFLDAINACRTLQHLMIRHLPPSGPDLFMHNCVLHVRGVNTLLASYWETETLPAPLSSLRTLTLVLTYYLRPPLAAPLSVIEEFARLGHALASQAAYPSLAAVNIYFYPSWCDPRSVFVSEDVRASYLAAVSAALEPLTRRGVDVRVEPTEMAKQERC
ncbi:hypothetical protein C8Q79DRAFT_187469 [Trametes meyenii]|nr:hypothetical protein C8Q79DRAFT_187469 [Trametes meyenii]